MADHISPKQSPHEYEPPKLTPRSGGGGGPGQIIIGLVMLVGGIGLSVAGTGRVFIGLIAVGVITLIKGIASSSG